MKNILITGGAGFIGSNLAEFLKKKKFNIYILDDLSVGNKSFISKIKGKFFKLKVEHISKIKNKIKFYCLIHLAAKAEISISKTNEKAYMDANIVGLQSVLNFCAEKKIKKIIFASSASVYGDSPKQSVKENDKLKPQHFYAYTKFIGENMIKNYCNINKLNFTILRFFNVYGRNSNAVVGKFIGQFLQKKPITIYGTGKQKRDFIFIDDLNRAIFKCIRSNYSNNKIYNVGSGKSISINKLKKLVSRSSKTIFLKKRVDDIEKSTSNIKKISRELKWFPQTAFREGLDKILKTDGNRLSKINLKR